MYVKGNVDRGRAPKARFRLTPKAAKRLPLSDCFRKAIGADALPAGYLTVSPNACST